MPDVQSPLRSPFEMRPRAICSEPTISSSPLLFPTAVAGASGLHDDNNEHDPQLKTPFISTIPLPPVPIARMKEDYDQNVFQTVNHLRSATCTLRFLVLPLLTQKKHQTSQPGWHISINERWKESAIQRLKALIESHAELEQVLSPYNPRGPERSPQPTFKDWHFVDTPLSTTRIDVIGLEALEMCQKQDKDVERDGETEP